MTKTYHDVEAVTRLLEEKEKDLELAAKIGQELLERNKGLDNKVARLELDLQASSELITQLRHDLQVKTDLLHVYTNDLEEPSPHEIRGLNVDVLERKIQDLEVENRKLHLEASKLAQEAFACEEKEERLVTSTVKHLTEANFRIKDLHDQVTNKVDESSRQREEINSLLAQVCELQGRVQRYSHENDDLTANLRVYQETQDELTFELADLKDKYREVVDLLRDTQEQLRNSRRKMYPGMGKHSVSGMFSLPAYTKDSGENSLLAEINSSLQSSKKPTRTHSKLQSEISDSDNDIPVMGSSAYRKVARTYKAIARGTMRSERGEKEKDSASFKSSAFQSYTISRENSYSPDMEEEAEEDEFSPRHQRPLLPKFDDEYVDASDDSGHGRSNTEMSGPDSLGSSAPTRLDEFKARELLRQATANASNRVSPSPGLQQLQQQQQEQHEQVPHQQWGSTAPIGGGSLYSMSAIGSSGASIGGPHIPASTVTSGAGLRSCSRPGSRLSGIGGGDMIASLDGSSGLGGGSRSGSRMSLTGGGLGESGAAGRSNSASDKDAVEIVEVQTVGELKPPSFHLSSTLLQSLPLGHVPGRNGGVPGGGQAPLGSVPGQQQHGSVPATPSNPNMPTFPESQQLSGHPALGMIPGRRYSEQVDFGRRSASDFDETEPLGNLTNTKPTGHPDFGSVPCGIPTLISDLGGRSSHAAADWLLDETEPLRPGDMTMTARAGGGANVGSGGSATSSRGAPSSELHSGNFQVGSDEFGGETSLDLDETEPIQSLSLTSTNISRKMECQLIGTEARWDGASPVGLGTAGQQTTGPSSALLSYNEDWSYSCDLDASHEFPLEDSTDVSLQEDRTAGAEPGNPETDSLLGDNIRMFHHMEDGSLHEYDHMSSDIGLSSDMLNYPGLMTRAPANPGINSELTSTLQQLNPAEVERRRRLLSRLHSHDRPEILSEVCSIAGYEDEEELLPYGVTRTNPRQSTSHIGRNSAMSGSFGGRMRLHDKLRIVKPLEGSLTLHNWSKLATPHLGGVLEERVGVAIKGNEKAGLDPLVDLYSLGEEDEEEDEDAKSNNRQPTRTNYTLTNSTVLHPDTTATSNVYRSIQMASGFSSSLPSRSASRMSSRRDSFSETGSRYGGSPFTNNLGLTRLLNERNISGARRSQLDLTQSGVTSLTPSVLTSPSSSRNMSPTETPAQTPERSLPGSPEERSAGLVSSFFSALKSAIYGEQRKAARSERQKKRLEDKRQKLGIMEAVEERRRDSPTQSPTPQWDDDDKECTPFSLPPLSEVSRAGGRSESRDMLAMSASSQVSKSSTMREAGGHDSRKSSGGGGKSSRDGSAGSGGGGFLSDFDARYLGALDDYDELEDIEPGFLTNNGGGDWKEASDYTKNWIGQLTVPSLTVTGRPGREGLGQVPEPTGGLGSGPLSGFMGGRGPGRIVSPGEVRPSHTSGLGVPGHPGTGALMHAMNGGEADKTQPTATPRQDLGTIPGGMSYSRSFDSNLRVERFGASSSYADDGLTMRGSSGRSHLTLANQMHNGSHGVQRSETFIGSITNYFFGRKGGLL